MVKSYKGFESLLFRQKAKDLAVRIYSHFRDSKDFGFRDQIQRASISISNNIAEGFERNSNKELQRFLYIAKGSCGEVRNMIIIWKELWYFTEQDSKELFDLTQEISKMISWYITKLQTNSD